MKRYDLIEIEQKNAKFFSLVCDPRVIVKLIPNVDAEAVQEAQRPWIVERVIAIAAYVGGKYTYKNGITKKAIGLIPNAPILNITTKENTNSANKNLKIEGNDDSGYYIMLPETEAEFKMYRESVEVLDGQHRIRAFSEEYIDVDFPDDMKYDMVYTIFDKLPKAEKEELFMTINSTQKSVPVNLLRLFKRELHLFDEKIDEEIFDFVRNHLNVEDFSPLKGRIIIGANKIPKGYQESQISKILIKSKTYNKFNGLRDNGAPLTPTLKAKILSNYINAWENVYEVSYQEPGKETITKIAGLRYILFLFPVCVDILLNNNKRAKVEEFKRLINDLKKATEIENVFTDETTSLFFRGEGATTKLAEDHAVKLQIYENQQTSGTNFTEGI